MPKIVDPDNLTTGVSVFWTTGSVATRTIGISSSLDSAGSLIPPLESGSDSGVTFQCLYSFAKEEWKDSDTLIRIPFPFVSITKTQFDVINNWDFNNDPTRYLVRDGGWSVISASVGGDDVTTQEWVNIRTLGTIGFDTTTVPPDPTLSDQVYFVQSGSENVPTDGIALSIQDFKMSGSVNQAIQQYSASKATGTLVVGYDFRGSTDIYVREYKKIYDSANIQTDLGVETQEYTQLSVPLQNSTDLKINTTTEGQADTEGPWRFVDIYFFSGSGFIASGSDGGSTYAGLVVSGSDGNWYIDNAGTQTGAPPGNGWTPYAFNTAEGTAISASAQIKADLTYTVFNKIITNGTGSAIVEGEGTGSTQDVYTSVQYQLRQEENIDKAAHFPTSNPITFLGKRTDSLLSFVGDTLVTADGVYVFPLKNADVNSVDFFDVSGSVARFPFIATGTLQFDTNIQADLSASYFMFFTNLGNEGGDASASFGLPAAVIVQDDEDNPITGSLRDNGGPATASVSFTFDYDGNEQGGRTSGDGSAGSADAGVTVVAIGLASAAYVTVTSNIERTKANNISLVAALERNYENPA